jgi:predicted MPP superfamily phosphohydrolase
LNRPREGSKKRWRILALALVLLALLVGYMALEADVVRVVYADVYLSDLPKAFEGTRILFLSDLHVSNICAPEKAAALVNQLQALKPDLLLLGGDYSSRDAVDYFRAMTGATSLADAQRAVSARRDQFFLMIRSFEAPLGKYAVPGNHDYEQQAQDLEGALELGGFTMLKNSGKVLAKGGQKLILAGLDDWRAGEQDIEKIASAVRGSDFVILLSHNPDALPSVISQPSADEKPWADLVLSGHTHGGQVALFGQGLFASSIYGNRYLSGWYEDGGSMLLVSNGSGCYMVPLRLGAPPQAHLITLYKK